MPNISIFKKPENYADFTFWRVCHQKMAMTVMFVSLIYAVFRWMI